MVHGERVIALTNSETVQDAMLDIFEVEYGSFDSSCVCVCVQAWAGCSECHWPLTLPCASPPPVWSIRLDYLSHSSLLIAPPQVRDVESVGEW
jgi:hypothetical protein